MSATFKTHGKLLRNCTHESVLELGESNSWLKAQKLSQQNYRRQFPKSGNRNDI